MDAKEMRVLKKARKRQAQIYRNTLKDMLWHSEGMRAHSLRNFRRSRHPQTKHTTSPALAQRYSIDLSPGRVTPRPKHIPPLKTVLVSHPDGTSERISQQELELVLPSIPIPFPKPTCLIDFENFKLGWDYEPPDDNNVYLTLDDTEITNAQMWHMTYTSGGDCFLTDNMLDICLSILGTSKNIRASGIAIMNSLEAQICAFPTDTGKEAYGRKYANTPIILMPINDAMGVSISKEQEAKQLVEREGSHWTLLLFDRRYKNIYYYDSFSMNNEDVQQQVHDIGQQVLSMLGEDESQGWTMRFQPYCPHQAYHNLCDDHGACGPFVWIMVKLCVEQVQRSPGQEIPDLTLEFQQYFAQHWNSADIRLTMRRSIEAVRMVRDFKRWADGRGAAGSAQEGNVQVGQRPLWVSGKQTDASLAQGEEYDSDIEGSIATVDSDEALDDEEPAPDHAELLTEEVPNTARLGGQDEVYTIRCIGHDASIAERAQKAVED